MATSFVSKDGLTYFWGKLKAKFALASHTHSNYLTATSEIRESYILFGGRSLSATVSPTDAGCIDEFGHNKLSFLRADCISVEYTTDGGETWQDYGLTDAQKVAMVTTSGSGVRIGKGTVNAKDGTLTNENCSDYKCRITISTRDSAGTQRLYTSARKLLLNVSTEGAIGSKCTVETLTIANYNSGTDSWSKFGEFAIGGWSGWNSIPFGITLGGSATQTGQFAKARLVFSISGVNASYNCTLHCIDVRLIGVTNWTTPSELARAGRLYQINTDQDATFPRYVTATRFYGNVTGDVTGNSSTATYPKGFSSVRNAYWGSVNSNAKGTIVNSANSSTDGSYIWSENGGCLHLIINGKFYQNEGRYQVLDTNSTIPVTKVSGLSNVATSGSYNDLSNKPTIPSAVTEATVLGWGFTKTQPYTHPATHPASMITGLATVATSGSYNDLTDKPSIGGDYEADIQDTLLSVYSELGIDVP